MEERTWNRVLLALKLAELALAILCVGLIVDPIGNRLLTNPHHIGLVYATFAGFIVINTALLLGQISEETVGPKVTWLVLSFAGGSLFLAAGSVVIHDWRHLWRPSQHFDHSKQYVDMMIASGIIAIFNAALYFVDATLTVRYG